MLIQGREIEMATIAFKSEGTGEGNAPRKLHPRVGHEQDNTDPSCGKGRVGS